MSWSGAGAAGSGPPVPAVLGPVAVRQRHGRMGLAAADPVQAGVDHDAVQPGGDRRVAAEPGRAAVRREQRVLEGVGGLLAVAEGAQRDRPEPVAMPADQLGERVRVAGDVGAQQSASVSGPWLACSAAAPPVTVVRADRTAGTLSPGAGGARGRRGRSLSIWTVISCDADSCTARLSSGAAAR